MTAPDPFAFGGRQREPREALDDALRRISGIAEVLFDLGHNTNPSLTYLAGQLTLHCNEATVALARIMPTVPE